MDRVEKKIQEHDLTLNERKTKIMTADKANTLTTWYYPKVFKVHKFLRFDLLIDSDGQSNLQKYEQE